MSTTPHISDQLETENVTGGHRTRVAAVNLDNMAERGFAQREDFP